MDPLCPTGPPQRQRIPKDGLGPRGAPDCYYTSRVLNSTARYVKFVKKLRADEEEQKKGKETKLKEQKDQQNSDFFIRCDRRGLIKKVAHRVDLCMSSYQSDLDAKKKRLKELYEAEEEQNIRAFVEQAQAGEAQVWQEKMERLQYLIDKRRKEHEEKYKDTPLSKCAHVLPCIWKIRAKEAQEIQLYQMREKESRQLAEKEIDMMWHEVAMKESAALAARMEYDTMERVRRDQECKQYSDYQLEQRRMQREKEKQRLKEESLWFKSIWEEDNRKEAEAERKRAEKRLENARECDRAMDERRRTVARLAAEDQIIKDTWDSLTGQSLADDEEKARIRRQKERELDECNRKMIELKNELAKNETADDYMYEEEARRRQEIVDKQRCEYQSWSQKTNRDVRKAMIDQIKDRQAAKEELKKKMADQDEYHRQLFSQLQALCKHKELSDAQARKDRQKQLLEQIEYNKLLKQRALQEEADQIKKGQLAAEEYERDIAKMLARPFYSDEVHPFMKQMAKGLKMREKCPCSKPNYCAK